MPPGDSPHAPLSHDPVAGVFWFGLAAAFLVLAIQSAIGLVAALALQSYDSPLDLDRNNGIPDLLSTAAILAGAVGAAELAAASTGERWRATGLAVLLSLVALDDFLQQEAGVRSLWGLTVVATLLTLTLLILAVARKGPLRARLTLLIGLFLLLVAVKNAYEYDHFLNLLGRGDQERGHFDYELGIVLKQGFEFLGWSLVAIGVWETAVSARVQRRRTQEAGRGSGLKAAPETPGSASQV